jgi:hypothetical protein
MLKQSSSRMKKVLAVLLAVLFGWRLYEWGWKHEQQ